MDGGILAQLQYAAKSGNWNLVSYSVVDGEPMEMADGRGNAFYTAYSQYKPRSRVLKSLEFVEADRWQSNKEGIPVVQQ